MKHTTGGRLIQATLWTIYPLAIYFGLQVMQPRYVALLLALALLLRRRGDAWQLLRGSSHLDRGVLIGLLALAGATTLTNSELLLRLYPAAVNAGMLLLFALSLIYPPSMAERFARLREPELPAAGVRYTRKLTQIWCLFFVANGSFAVLTALYSSREFWALYNGFIAYLLIGALFLGESLYRRCHLARRTAP
jgi:uncharacterized membrane protein